jgi:hypothetical protein
MLTEERIKQMRADAISDPRNAQEFWYMLMARAIESEATAPLLARIAELEQANEAFAARQEWWNSRMFELEQKVAELEADAKRYRWLRSVPNGFKAQRIVNDTPHGMDAAIDTAMKEQP